MTVFDISQENKEANGRKARTDTPMKIPNPIMPDGPRILYSQKPAEYSPSTHKDLSDTSLLLPDISTSDNFATTPLGSGMFTGDLHIIILYKNSASPVF